MKNLEETPWEAAVGKMLRSIGASPKLAAAAAAAGGILVAHYDQVGKTVAACELADVVISSFYTKA